MITSEVQEEEEEMEEDDDDEKASNNEWMKVTIECNRNTSNVTWWINCRQACVNARVYCT
jgi:hypothetical protein